MATLQINFFSKCLLRGVTFNAVVPVDKFAMPGQPEREKKPFKTLYLLHGIFGNHTDWLNGYRTQALAEERNLAVIMPAGENHFYVDNEASGQMHGEFIGRELVEFTRDLLPLSRKREDTFIAGLSMGGFGAVRNGLKYHDVFGCLAGMSSAFVLDAAVNSKPDDPSPIGRRGYFESVFGDLDKLKGGDKDPRGLVTSLKASGAALPKIYLSCGTEDFLIGANRDYHQFLLDNGVEHTYVEGPGAHTWEYWNEYIKKVMDWLPLEEK
jgi:S-formylglutathione hydrolase FrmB